LRVNYFNPIRSQLNAPVSDRKVPILPSVYQLMVPNTIAFSGQTISSISKDSPALADRSVGLSSKKSTGLSTSNEAKLLYKAVKQHDFEEANIFLEAGVNPNWLNGNGESALYTIVRYPARDRKVQQKADEMFEHLLRHGAGEPDKNEILRFLTMKRGESALQKIKLLLRNGADPSWQENIINNTDTAFDFAIGLPRLLGALNQNQTYAQYKQRQLSSKLKPGLHFEQQSIGDCYFLAAVDSAMNSPKWQRVLDRISVFKLKTPDKKIYRIRFPHGSSYRPVSINAQEIGKCNRGIAPVHSPKYLQLLELAFAKVTQRNRNIKKNELEASGEAFEIVRGGDPSVALQDLFGGEKIAHYLPGFADSTREAQLSEVLEKISKDTEHSYLMCLSTPVKTEQSVGPIRIDTDKVIIQLPHNHAYSLRNIDVQEKTITFADPHNSTHKVYSLPFKKCAETFDFVSGTKLPN
jgi:hypothetical protein